MPKSSVEALADRSEGARRRSAVKEESFIDWCSLPRSTIPSGFGFGFWTVGAMWLLPAFQVIRPMIIDPFW